jgi:hypothetical protein
MRWREGGWYESLNYLVLSRMEGGRVHGKYVLFLKNNLKTRSRKLEIKIKA